MGIPGSPNAACEPGDLPSPPERPSFRAVFDAHARFVWRVLINLGVPETEVPDASQQVFVVVYKKLARLEPGCSVRTFAYGICLRVAADLRRRAHVRHERLYADPPERSTPATQEANASDREALRFLERALDALPPPLREVFVLYELEELTMAEVVRVIGCPLQTGYSRLRAAHRAVAAAMTGHLEDGR